MKAEEYLRLGLVALVASLMSLAIFPSIQEPIVETIENPVKVIETEIITTEQKITQEESAIIKVVEKTNPSVVSVVGTKDVPTFQSFTIEPFDGPFFDPFRVEQPTGHTEQVEVVGGTGFMVDTNLILTNRHVVADTEVTYHIITTTGSRIAAEVVALDPVYDLALISAEIDLAPLPLGESDKLRVGQSVIANGNALGEFSNTISVGVVSGLSRSIGADLRSLIQTDAAINRGNSGGPLIDIKGRVIGVNTAIASGAQNIGFAIPIDIAKRAIRQFNQTGHISYAFLGVEYNPASHEVISLVDGGPAQQAGLLPQDIITSVGDVNLSGDRTLGDIIVGLEPESDVNVEVLRDGIVLLFRVTLGSR